MIIVVTTTTCSMSLMSPSHHIPSAHLLCCECEREWEGLIVLDVIGEHLENLTAHGTWAHVFGFKPKHKTGCCPLDWHYNTFKSKLKSGPSSHPSKIVSASNCQVAWYPPVCVFSPCSICLKWAAKSNLGLAFPRCGPLLQHLSAHGWRETMAGGAFE